MSHDIIFQKPVGLEAILKVGVLFFKVCNKFTACPLSNGHCPYFTHKLASQRAQFTHSARILIQCSKYLCFEWITSSLSNYFAHSSWDKTTFSFKTDSLPSLHFKNKFVFKLWKSLSTATPDASHNISNWDSNLTKIWSNYLDQIMWKEI